MSKSKNINFVAIIAMMIPLVPSLAQTKVHVQHVNGDHEAYLNVDSITFSTSDEGVALQYVHFAGTSRGIPITDIDSVTFELMPGHISCPDDSHPHAIDLGLPSGTLWACCNVGATEPEGYGGYYAWGETEEKDNYYKDTYIFYDGSTDKYQDIGSCICGTDYDVAHVKWGGLWQLPLYEQIKEMLENCTYCWTNINGVKGQLFISRINGSCIFLPATGNRYRSILYYLGDEGDYWSATRLTFPNSEAYNLGFYNGGANCDRPSYTYFGMSVRPVVNVEQELVDLVLSSTSSVDLKQGEDYTFHIISGNHLYSVWSSDSKVVVVEVTGNQVVVHAVKAGTSTVTVTDARSRQTATVEIVVTGLLPSCPDDNHPHALDLGLPSGTKWSCCNVGGTAPEERGDYYAWGETEVKDHYDGRNYLYYDRSTRIWQDLGSSISGTDYDVAHVKWGGAWQMPSIEQIQELLDHCTYLWTEINGIKGQMFISTENGMNVFIPIDKDDRHENCWAHGEMGYYWSGTQSPVNDCAYEFLIAQQIARWSYDQRFNGWFIRPVEKSNSKSREDESENDKK